MQKGVTGCIYSFCNKISILRLKHPIRQFSYNIKTCYSNIPKKYLIALFIDIPGFLVRNKVSNMHTKMWSVMSPQCKQCVIKLDTLTQIILITWVILFNYANLQVSEMPKSQNCRRNLSWLVAVKHLNFWGCKINMAKFWIC